MGGETRFIQSVSLKIRGTQPFWAECIIFSALKGRGHYDQNIGSQVSKAKNKIYLTSCSVDYSLILLPSSGYIKAVRIVISRKTFNSSMTFIFFHEITVIKEKFLVLFKHTKRPRAGSAPRVLHPCSRYCYININLCSH